MTSKYYIDGNLRLTTEQISFVKKNHIYVTKALNQIYSSVRKNSADIGGAFRSALLLGNLPKSDKLTGVNTNRLGEKLQYLTIALGDKNHPENKEIYQNSFLLQNILIPLYAGYIVDPDKKWDNYRRTNECEQVFDNKNSFDAAAFCQRDDVNTPIGLDDSKLIDAIVKTNARGDFYLDNTTSLEDEMEMVDALKKELNALKKHSRFCACFKNPFISDDEDDLF